MVNQVVFHVYRIEQYIPCLCSVLDRIQIENDFQVIVLCFIAVAYKMLYFG